MEEKITYSLYKILVSIYLENLKNEITPAELSKACEKSNTNPQFQQVKKIMEERGILIKIKEVGNTCIYTFNRKKLAELIEELEPYKITGKFIMKSKPFAYNF